MLHPEDSEAEPSTRGEPDVAHSLAPRRPRTIGGAIYLAVLVVTLGGLVLVLLGRWQGGLVAMGTSMLFAAAARLVIPESSSGMLGVRRKLVDVATLALIGGGLVALALLIPGPSGPPL